MPTYQYACTSCGEDLEVVQKFTDGPLTECSSCGGALRKVFSPVGVVFKGSGFYRNDSRDAARKASSNGASSSGSDNGKVKDGSSSSSSDSSSSSGSASSSSSNGSTGSSSSASSSSSSTSSTSKANTAA